MTVTGFLIGNSVHSGKKKKKNQTTKTLNPKTLNNRASRDNTKLFVNSDRC